MTLQDQLKADLKAAMKAKDTARKDAIRVVMGEMARSDKKEFSDDEIVRILKKLIKSEKEMLEKSSQGDSSAFIDIIEAYLPQMATQEEIRSWIEANIDFSAYKNKMQAMGAIMAHFGSSADGNRVKQVLQQIPG
ncbi:aspartyl-tRNA amidotransferase subunit B [Desulfosarcina widdelii]|uniref:Aspartyl-tRNA amidotransferase subunit B n=1 Tax=Desulfosarcina widdelii TaxID=947919 RepID=A0A5K7YY82_9BACT|nr:GatB/YqeY domain-containing protein [Desulfosarcina widdelii]BBO72873.1 aspartyl-tRNA amidotransferase subunit B [Desulfosarcina widdelii]